MPTLRDIESARERIKGSAIRTPLVRLNVDDAPAEIYLKLENLQPIGSFKIRGAANAIAQMSPDELSKGVLTASAGNMAQGVAFAARRLNIPCTVIAPETAPQTKIDAIERLGGRVVKAPFDEWWRAFQERSFPGVRGTFVHAFDDPQVMAGNGTIALEIIEDLPDVDTVIVPWGGGLACGIAVGMRALKPECKIYAAEVATAAPLKPSLDAGTPQVIDMQPSFVDGIGAKTVFPQMLKLAEELLDGSLMATLDEVASALRLIATRNRVIAEGAGATATACAINARPGSAKKVVAIVSGGNIDFEKLCSILAGS
ncbi:MAG: threonine/serine dehydratase [Pyrinomonadaceae bacterium]